MKDPQIYINIYIYMQCETKSIAYELLVLQEATVSIQFEYNEIFRSNCRLL